MKKISMVLFIINLSTGLLLSQVPQRMSYQSVIRDVGNNLLKNQAVGIRISILQGSISGTAVYIETQTPTTNNNGLVSIEIGNGIVVSGLFKNINWSSGTFFIKTETDPTGGTDYTIIGTTQLLSVPYALYAETSGTSLKMDSLKLVVSTMESMLKLGGVYFVSDYEGNEYKTVKIGNQLWMAENLRSTKYSDGKTISGVYAYKNDETTVSDFGRIYTWFAANAWNQTGTISKDVCPCGWHLPTDEEWHELVLYIDPNSISNNDSTFESRKASERMKLVDSSWFNTNIANNRSGFSILPNGAMYGASNFAPTIGDGAYFWTSTTIMAYGSLFAWYRGFGNNNTTVFRQFMPRDWGIAVRCIKDK